MKVTEMRFKIDSEEQMNRFGQKLADILEKGDVLCLSGDLGAGKTTLAKAIAKGLEVDEYVTSPSYTIVNEYEGRLPLYHFDVYRINDIEEMYELGYEEYFFGNGVCIIEWASMIEELLPEDRIWIEIYQGEQFEARSLILKASSDKLQKVEAII